LPFIFFTKGVQGGVGPAGVWWTTGGPT